MYCSIRPERIDPIRPHSFYVYSLTQAIRAIIELREAITSLIHDLLDLFLLMLGLIEERAQDADVVLTRGACNISNFTLHFVIHLHNAHLLSSCQTKNRNTKQRCTEKIVILNSISTSSSRIYLMCKYHTSLKYICSI